MTAADFARIKARFPALRWHHRGAPVRDVWARCGHLYVGLDYCAHAGWRWSISADDRDDQRELWAGEDWVTLGRCLRSLECAIRREARTLAGMIGEGVAL